MVVGPIGVAQENEALWFGTQSSQAELAGAAGVLFQVYHWEVVLEDIIANIGEGVLGGESYTLDLENGGLTVDMGMVEGLDEATMAEIEATVEELSAGIIAGDIVVLPVEPEATPAS